MNSEDIQRFFKFNSWKFNKCLEPMMACPEKAIRAHSIQNAQVFDLLATDGHLIMLQPNFSKAGPKIEFKSVGRNQASTFSGLCNGHDTSLFMPLDTKPFDVKDNQQLFLLAYRSVTRELHAVMDGAVKIQSEYSPESGKGKRSHIYTFTFPGGIEAAAYVSDFGHDELLLNVALNPNLDWIPYWDAGLQAGNAFTTCWLERQRGAWLQDNSKDFWCRKELLSVVANADIAPKGYGDRGHIIL